MHSAFGGLELCAISVASMWIHARGERVPRLDAFVASPGSRYVWHNVQLLHNYG